MTILTHFPLDATFSFSKLPRTTLAAFFFTYASAPLFSPVATVDLTMNMLFNDVATNGSRASALEEQLAGAPASPVGMQAREQPAQEPELLDEAQLDEFCLGLRAVRHDAGSPANLDGSGSLPGRRPSGVVAQRIDLRPSSRPSGEEFRSSAGRLVVATSWQSAAIDQHLYI
jgi:hypothetical protein